ncbi:hypothetical protein [Thermococcus henrietii]|uniref:hypothetical protein n=1 Tax=Thermococcus henrietii TaxID=2016361 RepID=UPI0011AB31A0|nr:hypothetical protein [Thermococcus henrietii]
MIKMNEVLMKSGILIPIVEAFRSIKDTLTETLPNPFGMILFVLIAIFFVIILFNVGTNVLLILKQILNQQGDKFPRR